MDTGLVGLGREILEGNPEDEMEWLARAWSAEEAEDFKSEAMSGVKEDINNNELSLEMRLLLLLLLLVLLLLFILLFCEFA